VQYTTFGASGVTVPRLCLGTATFDHQADERVAHQIMDTAAEAGVTFFDSADIYPMGAEVGRSEEVVGRWLQGKRDQIILATKAGGPKAFDTIGPLTKIASELGTSLATLSIAWVLANPTITSAIFGASRPDQLTDTLAAAELDLPHDAKAALDDLTHEYRWGDAAR
jgi:aryl-alcohol dehydrogenase-like predicted oxidoreductase